MNLYQFDVFRRNQQVTDRKSDVFRDGPDPSDPSAYRTFNYNVFISLLSKIFMF